MRLAQSLSRWFRRKQSSQPPGSPMRHPRVERLEDRLVLSVSPAAPFVAPPDDWTETGIVDTQPPSIEVPPTLWEGTEEEIVLEAADVTEYALYQSADESTTVEDAGPPVDEGELAMQVEYMVDAPEDQMIMYAVDEGELTMESEYMVDLPEDQWIMYAMGAPADGELPAELVPEEELLYDESFVEPAYWDIAHFRSLEQDPALDGVETLPDEWIAGEPVANLEDWRPELEFLPVLTTFGGGFEETGFDETGIVDTGFEETGDNPEILTFSSGPGTGAVDDGSAAEPPPYAVEWAYAGLSTSLGSDDSNAGLSSDGQDNAWPQTTPDAHDAALLQVLDDWDADDNHLVRAAGYQSDTEGLPPLVTSLMVWTDPSLDKLTDGMKLDEILASADASTEHD
jgi:hypothetical protein